MRNPVEIETEAKPSGGELHVYNEIDPLRQVVIWGEPGCEAILGQLLPQKISLFHERFDVAEARREFRGMEQLIWGADVEVVRMKEAFVESLRGSSLRNVPKSLDDLSERIKQRGRKFFSKYQTGDLAVLDLVDPLLGEDAEVYGEEAALKLNWRLSLSRNLPMADIFYARDQSNVLGNKIVLSRMRWPIRKPEVAVYAQAYSFLGYGNDLLRPRAGFIEGGDAVMFKGRCYVGVGVRTDRQALAELYGGIGTDLEKQGIKLMAVVNEELVIDMSSPNIAKRMSYGHLRSTIIGDALASIYRTDGFVVIRDNHIGDWGTQFGKLIAAIKKWGNEKELLASPDPIGALQELYVRFHDEEGAEKTRAREELEGRVARDGIEAVPGLRQAVEEVSTKVMERKKITRDQVDMGIVVQDALDKLATSALEEEGRQWFLRLEQGDPEARRLWRICVDLSLKEFNEVYTVLGVEFEETLGESFYEGMLADVIKEVKESGVGTVSKGALVVDMRDKKLDVAIVQKSDGASVYLTRDLATALYREKEMGADRALYVVGEDQKFYFQQLFEILRRLGHRIGDHSEHLYFGLVRLEEERMSTRKGRTILLQDVIDEGLRRAEDILRQKNPQLYYETNLRERVVRQVAVGALKWNDLSQDPRRRIDFDWDKALNFDGYSAPYVQYSGVRANSILKKQPEAKVHATDELPAGSAAGVYGGDDERTLIRQLAEYPRVLVEALQGNDPSKVATYVYELARSFNSFYLSTPVLKADRPEIMQSRLRLVAASSEVLSNGLGVLGIEVPEEM